MGHLPLPQTHTHIFDMWLLLALEKFYEKENQKTCRHHFVCNDIHVVYMRGLGYAITHALTTSRKQKHSPRRLSNGGNISLLWSLIIYPANCWVPTYLSVSCKLVHQQPCFVVEFCYTHCICQA